MTSRWIDSLTSFAKTQFVYDPGPVHLMVGSSSADIQLRGQVELV
jgi:hypothetical protein